MLHKLSNNLGLIVNNLKKKIVCFKIGKLLFLQYDNFESVSLTENDCTAEFNERTPVVVSRRTVQRKLHFFGYIRRSVRKKIGNRTINKKKRIAWCRDILHWTVGKRVILTDEKMIVLKPDRKLKVWKKSSEVWRP
jgi:hypothetical protein